MHKLLYPSGIAARVETPPPSSILFGDAASPEEACEGTIVAEVSLFRRLQIPVEEAASPLAWWKAKVLGFQPLHIWHGNFFISLVLILKRRESSVLSEF